MSKKKTDDGSQPQETSHPPAEPEKKRPVFSMKLRSDRTTVIEVAVWADEVQYQEGPSIQPSITVQRSYKTDDGWKNQDKPSFRQHDLPILFFLLEKAQAWVFEQRTESTPI